MMLVNFMTVNACGVIKNKAITGPFLGQQLLEISIPKRAHTEV